MYSKMSEEDIKKYESSGNPKNLAEVLSGINEPTPQSERHYRVGRVLNDESGLLN